MPLILFPYNDFAEKIQGGHRGLNIFLGDVIVKGQRPSTMKLAGWPKAASCSFDQVSSPLMNTNSRS